MKFIDWLKIKENATSTANVANFAQPTIGMVRRDKLPLLWKPLKKRSKKT